MRAAIAPRVGVLALQGAARLHASALAELGARPVEVRQPADLAGIDALVVPGGESTTMSMLLDSSGLQRPLEERVAEGLPVLGTCAGMILSATEVLDGRPDQRSLGIIDLAVRRNAFGRQRDSFEADLDVDGLAGGPFPAVFIRAPVVERVGDGVEVLARVEQGPVLCAAGSVVVCSFHPELGGDQRIHQLFLERMEIPCPVTPSGPASSTRRGPRTRPEASSSPS
ncbi:MAG: pyridoxal 5'-phosphate synthase glutaminase subunit PdxT [Actinomycetota bacterium]|nr:pyridoxal 5'-phosphate synthase glutaminase subunit PdxT [Actinomycetota bacterium]